MKKQNADQWLIDHVGLEQFRGGFERVSKLLKPLAQQIQKKSKIITIAGTNGKGQTSFDLFELLKDSGKKVALWTSPHILSVTERFGFFDQTLSEEQIVYLFEESRDLLVHQLSYYEFLFAVFLRQLLKRDDEYVILEVGLGGRLDAVNIFDADYAAIVSISLDHQAILGNTVEQILKEKWGVTRPGQRVLSSLESPSLRQEVKKLNEQTGAHWSDLFDLGYLCEDQSYSTRNKSLALCLLSLLLDQQLPQLLQLEQDLQRRSFSQSKGRQEQMTREGHRFIFIGAHNVDGVAKMIDELKQKQSVFDEVWFSFSQRPFSEISLVMEMFLRDKKISARWRYFSFAHPKTFKRSACEKEEQQLWDKWILELSQENCQQMAIEDHLKGGLDVVSDEKKILVTGSYYFISAVQKNLP